ncbi:hypothetical protein C2E20_6217 [Micractinium conductrix]|uniref:Haloacid dehalogenase n=1 Tax=Micractinium conductrix TaxID=554055 RepID=A0A2P6V8A7_9CHLO|nr:hypothetical protein C2E20_6217 [Micractinium conductrix]|eukprot:PSC70318.1 hypothetical protein C2E20_6217 [Micractinium conductrix]
MRVAATACPSDVFVLDFDGVVVDSEVEVSTSALGACAGYWPQLFGEGQLAERLRQRVRADLRATRPRLINGWEALVMARLVLEDQGSVARILADWEPLLETTLAAWGEGDGGGLSAAFEAHRAAQLAADADSFVALNPLYPGVADALQESPYPYYIASSKAAGRLVTLLCASLGLDIDTASPRLFAGLIPPNERKIAALRAIAARQVAAGGATLHFVDDRFETMHAIAEQAPDLLERWQLYLADWGYNTPEERAAAAALPGVRLLSRPQFLELLKWGVVMEVDDGCEPTQEEAEAAANAS